MIISTEGSLPCRDHRMTVEEVCIQNEAGGQVFRFASCDRCGFERCLDDREVCQDHGQINGGKSASGHDGWAYAMAWGLKR